MDDIKSAPVAVARAPDPKQGSPQTPLGSSVIAPHDVVEIDDESGEIEYPQDPERHRFQSLVGSNALAAVEAMLKGRPDLVADELASNAEGILSRPANRTRRRSTS